MKIVAVLIVVFALVIAIAPQFLDCQSHGRALTLANGSKVPMKCHWTAEAAIALGVPLLVVGEMLGFARRKETRRTLSMTGAALGAVTILLPTVLIGVCANNEMLCNSVMQPLLILLGTLVIALSLGAFISAPRVAEQPA